MKKNNNERVTKLKKLRKNEGKHCGFCSEILTLQQEERLDF